MSALAASADIDFTTAQFGFGPTAEIAIAAGVFHPNCLSDKLGLGEHFEFCRGTISLKIREFFLDESWFVAALSLPAPKTGCLDLTAVGKIDPNRQRIFPEQRGESRGR